MLFGRLDWQPSQEHRLMLRGNFTDYTGVNGTSSATTRTESYNGIEGLDTEAWVASYSSQWGNNVLNDLNINYIVEDTPREDKGLDLPDFQVSGLGAYGEVSFLPIVSTTERKGISDTVTWLTGDHILKFGGEYNDTSIDQIFKGNWRGVFRFNSRADFLAGKWASYNQFGGLGGLTADEAGRADFGQKETALFVQDQWFMKSNVTISAGVRFESQDNPNDPILNPLDRNANGSYNLTAEIPDADITDQISPRFGITWSPGDQKSVLRFSAGRFWARTPAILLRPALHLERPAGHPVPDQRAHRAGRRGPAADRSAGAGLGSELHGAGDRAHRLHPASRRRARRASSPSTRTSRTPTPTASPSASSVKWLRRPSSASTSPTPRRSSCSASPTSTCSTTARWRRTDCRATAGRVRTPTTAA